MEYRRLVHSDLDSYYENRLRAVEAHPTAFLTTVEETRLNGKAHFLNTLGFAGNERAIFGAILEGKVVGSVGIFQEVRPKWVHKAKLWGMHVDAEYRNRGIGEQIMRLLVRHAKEKLKVVSIGLTVESGNAFAIRLYEQFGFKKWGVEPKAMIIDGKYYDEDHMVLLLE